jgi:hypothetical protein
MALKFAMIVEMVNRLSKPGREARRDTRELTKSVRELGRAGTVASRGLDRAARSGDRMRNRLGVRLFASVRRLAGPAGLKAVEKAGYGAGRAIGFTIRKMGGLIVKAGQFTAAIAGLATGAFFGGIISTTAKFEQFQIMLEGTEGSATKAKKAMAWVTDFAKRTPYELDQVMEAFVQLKAYGIDPMDGALTAAGDAASGMSKRLIDAVEALADAQTGEFERLKSFAITTQVQGNKVAFTYMKNGKEITRQTTKNAAAIKSAITGIWEDRFGGGMARQAGTFKGILNNISDWWTGFMLRIGQAGVFDKVKAKLQGVLDWLDSKEADGSIERWANRVSDRLGEVIDRIKGIDDADIGNFLDDLGSVAKACVDIISALGKIHSLIMKIDGAWGSVDKWTDRWMIGGSGWGDIIRGGPAKQAPKGKVLPQSTRDTMWRNALTPRAPARGVRTQPMNPAFLRTPAAQKVPVGGTLTVNVKADPGLSARPTKMATANSAVPLVYRGGANMGWG